MRGTAQHRSFGICITLALGLVLLLGGFAHSALAKPADLLAYLASGGDPVDLCGSPDDPSTQFEDCAACRLAGEATVPERAMPIMLLRIRADLRPLMAVAKVRGTARPAPMPPLRGPPLA